MRSPPKSVPRALQGQQNETHAGAGQLPQRSATCGVPGAEAAPLVELLGRKPLPQAGRRMQRWRGGCLCLFSAARQNCICHLAGGWQALLGHVEMEG